MLESHGPLESATAAVTDEVDIHSSKRIVESFPKRALVGDTDTGTKLKAQVADLERLLETYRARLIPEVGKK